MAKKASDQELRELLEEQRVAQEKVRTALFSKLQDIETRGIRIRELEQRVAELEGALTRSEERADKLAGELKAAKVKR